MSEYILSGIHGTWILNDLQFQLIYYISASCTSHIFWKSYLESLERISPPGNGKMYYH